MQQGLDEPEEIRMSFRSMLAAVVLAVVSTTALAPVAEARDRPVVSVEGAGVQQVRDNGRGRDYRRHDEGRRHHRADRRERYGRYDRGYDRRHGRYDRYDRYERRHDRRPPWHHRDRRHDRGNWEFRFR
jgi:hypothetical protein